MDSIISFIINFKLVIDFWQVISIRHPYSIKALEINVANTPLLEA